MTYIDFLKTPCHPWKGGSVNKLHLLGDYVEVSGNDLSNQKKHCEDSRCHLLSPDCEPLSLQLTPMRSYNPYLQEKMRQRWVKCCKAIHPVRGLKWSEVGQLCLTLCDPMNYSLPRSSVHGIFQARILEWVAISFSRGSSQPRHQTRVFSIVGRCFIIWAIREARFKSRSSGPELVIFPLDLMSLKLQK